MLRWEVVTDIAIKMRARGLVISEHTLPLLTRTHMVETLSQLLQVRD